MLDPVKAARQERIARDRECQETQMVPGLAAVWPIVDYLAKTTIYPRDEIKEGRMVLLAMADRGMTAEDIITRIQGRMHAHFAAGEIPPIARLILEAERESRLPPSPKAQL